MFNIFQKINQKTLSNNYVAERFFSLFFRSEKVDVPVCGFDSVILAGLFFMRWQQDNLNKTLTELLDGIGFEISLCHGQHLA